VEGDKAGRGWGSKGRLRGREREGGMEGPAAPKQAHMHFVSTMDSPLKF
jgi:hypothetical protein